MKAESLMRHCEFVGQSRLESDEGGVAREMLPAEANTTASVLLVPWYAGSAMQEWASPERILLWRGFQTAVRIAPARLSDAAAQQEGWLGARGQERRG